MFEIIADIPFLSADEIDVGIKNGMLRFLGELSAGKANINFLKETWNCDTQRGVLSMEHTYADEVRAALLMVDSVGGKKVALRSLYTTGLINKTKGYVNKSQK